MTEIVNLFCNKCGWTGSRPYTQSTLHTGCDYHAVVVETVKAAAKYVEHNDA